MSRYLHYETAPPMWGIEPSAVPGAGSVLRIGKRRVAIADIRSVAREEETERDVRGLITMGGWFILAAMLLVMGVVEIGWRTRFLIGAFILGCLAFVSLTESLSINRIRFVRLRFTTAGDEVVFTTADPADADALAARVAAEQRAPSRRQDPTSLPAPAKSTISRASRQAEACPEGATILNSGDGALASTTRPAAPELSMVSPDAPRSEPQKPTHDSDLALRPLADGPAPHRQRADGGTKLSLRIEVGRPVRSTPR